MIARKSTAPEPTPEIAALSAEIESLRSKRRGIETALASREQKLNRLKSQQVLAASPGVALPLAPCFA